MKFTFIICGTIRDYLYIIDMKFLNFVFKVHLPELWSRSCTTFRDYNEVFNLRIPRYVHGKCSYCIKLLLFEEELVVGDGDLFSIFGKFNKNRHGGITRYQYQVEV